MLLPAILSAREASRRSTCTGHLHQVGVALANIEQVEKKYPTYDFYYGKGLHPLLQYLEQRDLYQQLTSTGLVDPLPFVEVLLCPSDHHAWRYPGEVNYIYNEGTLFRDSGVLNGFSAGYQQVVTPRDIIDGLSNTAAMAERLIATPALHRDLFGVTDDDLVRDTGRYLWYVENRFGKPGQELRAAAECRTRFTTPLPSASGLYGGTWRGNTGYDHLLSPNQRGCHNDIAGDYANSGFNAMLIPPSSLHSGGVNVLMADGHIRFVSDSVGDPVWRAAGTRAGGETETLR